jgi:iron complex outermembrane receptor protein
MEYDSGTGVFVKLSGDYIKDNSDARQGHRLIPGLFSGAPVLDDVYDTRAGLSVPKSEVEAYGGALHVDVDVSDTVTLRNILAYRKDRSDSPIDFDSLPAADLDVPVIYKNDQFSEELQLLYTSDDLNGLLGFYYLDANASDVFDVLLATTGAIIGLPGLNAQTLGDVDTKTWSVFGDFTYDLSDAFSVSLGGRYTSDKRHAIVLRRTFVGGLSDSFGGAGIPVVTTSDFDGSKTFKEFTPRASVSWQPNENNNFYFTYSKGFKGGGFDPRGQTSAAPDFDGDGTVSQDEIFDFMMFEPEKVDSYELGWKASMLDGRMNIRLAGFLGSYKNVQIPGSAGLDTDGDGVSDTFIGITSNAADADINGIEFEGSALVGRDFAGVGSRANFSWSFGLLDAQYNTFIDAFGNDVADQRVFQNTPKYTASATMDFGFPVANGELSIINSVSFRSDASQFEVKSPLDQDAFALYDASIVWRDDADKLSIGLHGKNLFDTRYKVAGYNFMATDPATGRLLLGPTGRPISTLGLEGTLTAFYGDPRRVFLTVGYKF